MKELDLAIRTLFSEFQETSLARAALEDKLLSQGTFTKKKVKGNDYWYIQRYENGVAKQKYLAAADPTNDKDILAKRDEQKRLRADIKKMLTSEGNKAAMLRRGGLPGLDSLTASIISRFSENGLLFKNGVLVGSHAFAAYSGMLGALFNNSTLRTMDIDIALENEIGAVPLKTISIMEVLESVSADFREVPSMNPKYPTTSFVGPGNIRVDIVTPLIGRPKGGVKIKGVVDATAAPLRFMDFLLAETVDTVLIGPKGGIPVTVPTPERFAVHKLIISTYRPASEAAKSAKDIEQARQLIEACKKERPFEFAAVLKEAEARGPKWKKAVERMKGYLQ